MAWKWIWTIEKETKPLCDDFGQILSFKLYVICEVTQTLSSCVQLSKKKKKDA